MFLDTNGAGGGGGGDGGDGLPVHKFVSMFGQPPGVPPEKVAIHIFQGPGEPPDEEVASSILKMYIDTPTAPLPVHGSNFNVYKLKWVSLGGGIHAGIAGDYMPEVTKMILDRATAMVVDTPKGKRWKWNTDGTQD